MSSPTSPLNHNIQPFLDHHTWIDTANSPTDECPICRETYHTTFEPRTLIINIPGCTHAFCLHCIKLFLTVNPHATKNCPMCRAPWLPMRDAGALYSGPKASPLQRPDQTEQEPIIQPHGAILMSGETADGIANVITLLRLRERTLSVRADTMRVNEALTLRRMTQVAEREMDVTASEVDVGRREAAVRARELAVQQLAEYIDDIRANIARQQVEVKGLIERQREELERVFGQAEERRN